MKNIGKIQLNSPVIIGFTILSAIVLLINSLTGGIITKTAFSIYPSDYHDIWFYVRLFGHVLGNASWEEYMRNMLYILVLGPMLEEKYKSSNMFIMILITSFVTGFIYVFLFDTPTCGAECVVFMLMLLAAMSVIKDKMIPISFILVIVIYIANVILTQQVTSGDYSIASTIIGGICGSFFGYVMSSRKK